MAEISENHKRVIGSTLKLTENRLIQIEQILNRADRTAHESAQTFISDIDEQQQEEITKNLHELTIELIQLKDKFDLDTPTLSMRNMVHSYAVMMWEELLNTSSHNLKGYGQMDEENAKILDAQIKKMVDVIERVIQVTKK